MDRPELSNRTWLCTVVFLDMVGYSKHSVTQQMTMKRRFNSRLTEAIAHVAVRDRIVLDTGDGAAICFMGDPEEALRVALHLYHGFREEAQSELLPVLVRIGIHVGPVKIMKDINGQLNTIGDGINVAQRIMSFAQPNQILVSRSFYEVVACLSYEYEQMFQYMGVQTDKHVREYMLYAIVASPEPPVPESARLYEASLWQVRADLTVFQEHASLPLAEDPEALPLLERVETALSCAIGPLARVLVKQAAEHITDLQVLCERLATHIPTESERRLFFESLSSVFEMFLPVEEAVVSASPSAEPTPSVPEVLARPMPTWEPALLETIQQRLAHYLGPLAKILVQRAARQATSADDLCRLLAEHLVTAQDKAHFLRDNGMSA